MCSTCAAESASDEVPFAWENSLLVWSVPNKVNQEDNNKKTEWLGFKVKDWSLQETYLEHFHLQATINCGTVCQSKDLNKCLSELWHQWKQDFPGYALKFKKVKLAAKILNNTLLLISPFFVLPSHAVSQDLPCVHVDGGAVAWLLVSSTLGLVQALARDTVCCSCRAKKNWVWACPWDK